MNKDIIIVKLKDKTEKEMEIVLTYNDEKNKYIIYKEINNNDKYYVAKYIENNNEFILDTNLTDYEFKKLETVLNLSLI